MKRRHFLKILPLLPFIGKLIAQSPTPIRTLGWKVSFKTAILNPSWECRLDPSLSEFKVSQAKIFREKCAAKLEEYKKLYCAETP